MSVVTSLVRPTIRSGPSSTRRSSPNVLHRETHAPDYVVLVAVVALTAIGVLMVYSSSAMQAYAGSANSFAVVGPQVVWGALGLIALMVMSRVDYRRLRTVGFNRLVTTLTAFASDSPIDRARRPGSRRSP